MRHLFLVLAGFFLIVPALAQELPDEVASAYVAYTAAIDAEDYESAYASARQALRAAEQAGLDAETTAILAENYGQLAEAMQDFAVAASAYERSAELSEEVGSPVADVARLWIRASNAALIGDELDQAVRFADRAADLAENADTLDEAEQARLRFAGRALQAHALWRHGRVRGAQVRASEALRIAGAGNLTENRLYPMMTFITGAAYAIDKNHEEAAFRLSQAYALMPAQQEALGYWLSYIRGQLSARERARLFERIVQAGLVVEGAGAGALFGDDDALENDPDFVDASPSVRRAPDYPMNAAAAGFEGVAVIRFSVNEQGRVVDPDVVLSIPFSDFGESALDAVRRWRYEPATREGRPVRRDGVVTQFEFMLAD